MRNGSWSATSIPLRAAQKDEADWESQKKRPRRMISGAARFTCLLHAR